MAKALGRCRHSNECISKRPYRGINLWLLLSLDYPQNLFLTWDQLKKIGGSVKQGEHGHVVVFWKTPQKNTDRKSSEEKKLLSFGIIRSSMLNNAGTSGKSY